MTGSLRKWVYKAIDIKSILIQECVGFFPLFLTSIYQCVMTWQSEADELPNAGHWDLKGGCGPRFWYVLSNISRLNVSFVFLIFINTGHCSYFQHLETPV